MRQVHLLSPFYRREEWPKRAYMTYSQSHKTTKQCILTLFPLSSGPRWHRRRNHPSSGLPGRVRKDWYTLSGVLSVSCTGTDTHVQGLTEQGSSIRMAWPRIQEWSSWGGPSKLSQKPKHSHTSLWREVTPVSTPPHTALLPFVIRSPTAHCLFPDPRKTSKPSLV